MDVASPSPLRGGVLTDVVAYVEVWSSNRTENYTKTFTQQLLELGAKISKTFNKQVTHVVFKDGHQVTWDKAVKTGVKLVSILWVEKCRDAAAHVDESSFPAINTNDGLPQLLKKRRKCMQPKDFVEKTPENDRRLQRKFDKMVKQLDVQKASVDVPVLLFDEGGTLMFSPKAVAADRCNAMEKRINEMRNGRENLSPTASQLSQMFDFPPLKPSLGNSPITRDSSHENDSEDLDTSYDELWGSTEKKNDGSKSEKVDNQKCESKTALEEEAPCSLNPSCKSVNLTPQQIKKINLPQISSGKRRSGSRLKTKISKMVDIITGDSDSGSEMFFDKPSANPETSNLDYTSMANRLIAKCNQKGSSRKRSSVLKLTSSPSSSCSPIEKDLLQELTKPHVSNHNLDSEESCSNFEDFFSSFLKSTKTPVTPFSFGAPSQMSPSSPLNFSKRSAEDVFSGLDTCNSKRRRRTDHTRHEPLVSKPIACSKTKRDAQKYPTVPENTNPIKLFVSNTMESSSQRGEETTTTNFHLGESEVTSSGGDKVQAAPEITPVADCGKQICPEKAMEVACTKALDELEAKGARLDLQNITVLEKQEKKMKTFRQSAHSDTSACNAIHGLSEMFNEQRNKCTVESKNEKSRKITRSLVMTSMSSEQQNAVIQVVKKYRGFLFSDDVCETTTHVIAGSPRRTLNIVLGIARGCWIISYDWVLWSLEHGHWIPEEPYELSDHFPAAPDRKKNKVIFQCQEPRNHLTNNSV
ncbi:microcephalin isoform X2 [Ascaphus truei]|uniref:microcephalin isoform X2 n=1 Tax=Ascaphus truei TaxID=8439 RepID=UPI003F5984C3